ncbi:DNA starvation/stationary phase protection protein [Pyxidicoccus parkwayensis]|uniref:DNA starvation/stationary phase protection protein n=1 Tax=Pyxidicoccus parkwayensis TaxID=2813578 RepID=A0ABX7NV74_9BACT|nr:DNA starvation/stationary phase protection protein [Pyxidicoccus parkwaysis]QSQ22815.1 DNA starvation/stationary phase protection protein [Pyxidicoccus parkwaysis]
MKISPALNTPTDLQADAIRDISAALNALLADVYALHIKIMNFRWHMSGPHFRDYQAMLQDHALQLLVSTASIAERVRAIGASTLHSIGDIARRQRLLDNDADYVAPSAMLTELRDDNQQLAAYLRETHDVCEEHGDVASANLIERWLDETERRIWQLFEATRAND